MHRLFFTAFASLILCVPPAFAAPVRVLLPGESSPAATQLAACLKTEGVELTTSTGPVTEAQLAAADVLVLFDTRPSPLPDATRAAVEKFTARGGGLVVIGGGIGAGDWLKPLAGGTWTANSRRFPNKLMFYTVTDAHPVTRDASGFDIDDETFYDLDLDPKIKILASAFTPKVTAKRIDPRSPERLDRANVYDLQPQMWAWEAADGHRAFTLLQGQADSLKHASLREFILRGVTWVAKQENADALRKPADPATLRYPAGGPRTPADTVKSFDLSPGFTAGPVAGEPLINKPIAMDWDARGRLWIAETPEYPNGRRPAIAEPWRETGVLKPGNYDRPATDRISILTDTDGDGVMDKKDVFHQGLELVTGFCLYGDGVIAVGQPDIVFLHDTDGDGKADREERLFTGFTPGDTHFVANHFMAAPDGWIYANTGSGADAVSVARPGVKGKVVAGVFRFKPDGSAIEQVASRGGNAFGLDITSDMEVYFGQATSGNPVQHVVLPEPVLGPGKVGNTGSAESVIRGRKVIRADMPSRAPFMQIDAVGGYSSACASTVPEGGAWPAGWEDGVFCTEPILDIIHYEKFVPEGPTFSGKLIRQDREWLRAGDSWFFPVDLQFGPDGAMYVLDFYNPVVAHSDSRGPQHSRSGATTRPDREHYFGRIYRIQHEQAKTLTVPDLTKADAAGLVAAFSHLNKRTRFTAQRLLMESKDASGAVPALVSLAAGEGFAPARVLALWSLHRLGKLDEGTLGNALRSGDAGVRRNALLVIEAAGGRTVTPFAALLSDPEPRVRLAALRAMSAGSLSPDSAAALLAVIPSLADNWSRSAAVAAASSNPVPVLEAALASQARPAGALLDLATSLTTGLTEKGDAAGLAWVVIASAKAAPEALPLVRAVLGAAAARPGRAPESGDFTAPLQTLLASADTGIAAGALPLAIAWAPEGPLKAAAAERVAGFLQFVADDSQPDPSRAAVAFSLARSRAADARILPALIALLKTSQSESPAARSHRRPHGHQRALPGRAAGGRPAVVACHRAKRPLRCPRAPRGVGRGRAGCPGGRDLEAHTPGTLPPEQAPPAP